MLWSQFSDFVTAEIYDFHYKCIFTLLIVAMNRIIGLSITRNTNMTEKIHSLPIDSNTLLLNDTKTLSTKKERERRKESSCCRKSSRRKIRQKVDLSIPKDCFSSCVNCLQFTRSRMDEDFTIPVKTHTLTWF